MLLCIVVTVIKKSFPTKPHT